MGIASFVEMLPSKTERTVATGKWPLSVIILNERIYAMPEYHLEPYVPDNWGNHLAVNIVKIDYFHILYGSSPSPIPLALLNAISKALLLNPDHATFHASSKALIDLRIVSLFYPK